MNPSIRFSPCRDCPDQEMRWEKLAFNVYRLDPDKDVHIGFSLDGHHWWHPWRYGNVRGTPQQKQIDQWRIIADRLKEIL